MKRTDCIHRPCGIDLRVMLTVLMALLLVFALQGGMSKAFAAKLSGMVDWTRLDAANRVEFPSGATPADRWGTAHDRVRGYLRKPAGDGPFPAVVLLHGTQGPREHQVRWVHRLAEWGYVALLVHSIRPGAGAGMDDLAHDAYGALRYLREKPFVDSGRVALIGWGLGGMAVLRILEADPARPDVPRAEFSADGTLRFRVGVAYHSQCPRRRATRLYAPALLLEGERMYAGRPEDCKPLSQTATGQGAAIRVKLYPGTTPGFDFGEDTEFGDFKLFYDPAAERDAKQEVKDLLETSLR